MKVGGCLLRAVLFLLLLPVVLAAFALPSADFVLLAALFWTLYFYQKEQP